MFPHTAFLTESVTALCNDDAPTQLLCVAFLEGFNGFNLKELNKVCCVNELCCLLKMCCFRPWFLWCFRKLPLVLLWNSSCITDRNIFQGTSGDTTMEPLAICWNMERQSLQITTLIALRRPLLFSMAKTTYSPTIQCVTSNTSVCRC